MFKIKITQNKFFAEIAERQSQVEAVQRLSHDFSALRTLVGESGLQELAISGYKRALGHGLRLQRSVDEYIRYTMYFGHRFSEDPLFLWAGETLRYDTIFDESLRMDVLRIKVDDFRNVAVGADGRLFFGAIRRALGLDYVSLPNFGRSSRTIPELLQKIYPEKWSMLSSASKIGFIELAYKRSAEHVLGAERAASVQCILMFMLGSYYDSDPMFPWARQILEDTSATGEQRGTRLFLAACALGQRFIVTQANHQG